MKYHGDFNPYQVNALWEVRLRPEIIEKIQKAAQNYRTSMSWVVRYCTFRLFRKKQFDISKLHKMAQELREKNQLNPIPATKLHRLRVCLYGDDERVFLELKYRYGLTTTMLVRIALKMYLHLLLEGKVPVVTFFYYGLKFFAQTRVMYSYYKKKIPQVDFHFKALLKLSDYWDIPPGPPPAFLLP